jgi:hypothetical protein
VPGHLVIARETLEVGWWEAVVVERNGDLVTVRYPTKDDGRLRHQRPFNTSERLAQNRRCRRRYLDDLDPAGRGAGQQPQPGLVVVIQNRDGSQVDVVSPPPAPMIEHEPLAGQRGDLEPQRPRN